MINYNNKYSNNKHAKKLLDYKLNNNIYYV